MRILGLDPGSRYTGYGVIEKEGNRLQHVTSGRINATRGETFLHRLEIIYDSLTTILAEWPCDTVAVESIFTARNAMSTIKLGHARGVTLLAVKHANLGISEYAPASVKQAVAGHGRARKEDLRRMVQQILGISGDIPEDASDALAVAICHGHSLDFQRRLTTTVP